MKQQWQTTKRVMAILLVSVMMVQLTGCGYLFWPERRNQPRSDNIDPTVAILDGLGLLLFIVPGVVAFIVDFSTHTIYFPPGKRSVTPLGEGEMVSIRIPDDQLTIKGIDSIVSEHVGSPVNVDSESVKIYPIASLGEGQVRLADLS